MARLVQYQHKGSQLIGVDKATIDGLEAAIRWAEVEVPKQARKEMNTLAHTMALINVIRPARSLPARSGTGVANAR
jgi:hypothetical protein